LRKRFRVSYAAESPAVTPGAFHHARFGLQDGKLVSVTEWLDAMHITSPQKDRIVDRSLSMNPCSQMAQGSEIFHYVALVSANEAKRCTVSVMQSQSEGRTGIPR
jgi:hypothetical protein